MKTSALVSVFTSLLLAGSADAAARGLRRQRHPATISTHNNSEGGPDEIQNVHQKKPAPFRKARGPHHTKNDVKKDVNNHHKKKHAPFREARGPHHTKNDVKKKAIRLPESFDDIVDEDRLSKLEELPDSFDDVVEENEDAIFGLFETTESNIVEEA